MWGPSCSCSSCVSWTPASKLIENTSFVAAGIMSSSPKVVSPPARNVDPELGWEQSNATNGSPTDEITELTISGSQRTAHQVGQGKFKHTLSFSNSKMSSWAWKTSRRQAISSILNRFLFFILLICSHPSDFSLFACLALVWPALVQPAVCLAWNLLSLRSVGKTYPDLFPGFRL